MTELRLHAIGLYAGFDVSVPEPEGDNGTSGGLEVETEVTRDGLTITDIWIGSMLSIIPYWILLWQWWPVIVFPLVFLFNNLKYEILIGADLLQEKHLLAFNSPDINPEYYEKQESSFIESNIDMLVMGALCAGIALLSPLLIAAEGFVRSGIGNLTPFAYGVIASAILVAVGIVIFSTLYIESYLLAQGIINHGDAAFRYEVLLIAIILCILGFSAIPYVHETVISQLNKGLKDVAGPYTRKTIKEGRASKHLMLMTIVMCYLIVYFGGWMLYHLYMHEQMEV